MARLRRVSRAPDQGLNARQLAILCPVHRESTLFETIYHERRDFIVIFDNQYAHRRKRNITGFSNSRTAVCKCHSLLSARAPQFTFQAVSKDSQAVPSL